MKFGNFDKKFWAYLAGLIDKKEKTCFLWENQYFELDKFIYPIKEMVLELEIEGDEAVVRVPDFLKIKREVTDDKAFSNYELARADYGTLR